MWQSFHLSKIHMLSSPGCYPIPNPRGFHATVFSHLSFRLLDINSEYPHFLTPILNSSMHYMELGRDTELSSLQSGEGRYCFHCSSWEINTQESAKYGSRREVPRKWGRAWSSAQSCRALRQQMSSGKDFSGCFCVHLYMNRALLYLLFNFLMWHIATDRFHLHIDS